MNEEASSVGLEEGEEYIFVTSYFHKGLRRRIYAWEYGLQAFRLKIRK